MDELLINTRNNINLIENPNKGGIPANDIITIKNIRLNGNVIPTFLKSDKLLIYLTS